MGRNDRTDYLDTTTNYATGINDLQFEKNIQEQKIKKAQEDAAIEKMNKKQETKDKIKEYKQNTIPIYKIRKSLLVTTFLCFILGLIALFTGFWEEAGFSIFCGILTIIVGQNVRLKKKINTTRTNKILYNLQKSMKDFIDYQIPYEIYENEDVWLDTYTGLGMLVYLFLPSSNILYGLTTILIVLVFLIAFSSNHTEKIYDHATILIPSCMLGILVKFIGTWLFTGAIQIELINVILINLFTMAAIYTKDLKVTKPKQMKPIVREKATDVRVRG